MRSATRTRSFYFLATVFTAFIIFLYGPMVIIVLLSFQGPEGGLTFPMNGISVFWFERLWAVSYTHLTLPTIYSV